MHLLDKNRKSAALNLFPQSFFFFSGKSMAHTVILCQGQLIPLRWRQGLMKRPLLGKVGPFLWNEHVRMLSCPVVSDSFATPRTVPHQALLSMGFPRQEYWSGLSFPSPGDLPNPGIKPMSPALAGGFFTTELPGKPVTWAGYKSPFPITAVSAYSVPWTSSTMWDVLPYLWLSLLFHSWWYKLIFCDFSKKQLDN